MVVQNLKKSRLRWEVFGFKSSKRPWTLRALSKNLLPLGKSRIQGRAATWMASLGIERRYLAAASVRQRTWSFS